MKFLTGFSHTRRTVTPGCHALHGLLWALFLAWNSFATEPSPGAVDPTFASPNFSSRLTPRTIAFDSSGRMIVAGSPAIPQPPQVVRLDIDGRIDPTFRFTTPLNGPIRCVALLPDGTSVLGGAFTATVGTQERKGLLRLNTNGAIVQTFAALTGFSGEILTIQPDAQGRILIGGSFYLDQAVPRGGLVRLRTDGTIDTTFNPSESPRSSLPLRFFSPIRGIQLLSDGRISVMGDFQSVDGIPRPRLARLSTNGTLDRSFDPLPFSRTGFVPDSLTDIQLTPDTGLWVAGGFTHYGGLAAPGLVRLTAAGDLAPGFIPMHGLAGNVHSFALEPDGRVVVAIADQPTASTILRVFPDGERDTGFNSPIPPGETLLGLVPGPGGSVYRILEGGGGVRIQRLITGDPAPFAPRSVGTATDQTVPEGADVVLTSPVVGHPRPQYQWLHSGTNLSGATNLHLNLPRVRLHNAGFYHLIASNALGTLTSLPIQLGVTPGPITPGSLDLDFDSGFWPNSLVCAAVAPGGKLIVAGGFTAVQGQRRAGLVRLNTDGSIDPTFVPDTTALGQIHAVAPLPDQRLIVAGWNPLANRITLVRLDERGNRDPGFTPFSLPNRSARDALWAAPDGTVFALDENSKLVRIRSDGTRDPNYTPVVFEGYVQRLIAADHGRFFALGFFSLVNFREHHQIVRLLADGTVDPSFLPERTSQDPFPDTVLVQANGGLVLGGTSYTLEGEAFYTSRAQLIRLQPDGRIDRSFVPEHDPSRQILAMAEGPGATILLASSEYNAEADVTLTRLFPDGSIDVGFRPDRRFLGWPALLVTSAEDRIVFGFGPVYSGYSREAGVVGLFGGPSAPMSPQVLQEPASHYRQPGADVLFAPVVQSSPPPQYQWLKDGVPLSAETNRVLALTNLETTGSGTYQLLATHPLGSIRTRPARLEVESIPRLPGTVDPGFSTGSGPNGPVNALAELPDGKWIIAGDFTSIDGQPRPRFARLNTDGSLDTQFAPAVGPMDGDVKAAAVLADGTILLAGAFLRIGTRPRTGLAAFRPDGTWIDTGWVPTASQVTALAVTPEGQVFTAVDGGIHRWRAGGVPDGTIPWGNGSGDVYSMTLQSDGRLLSVGRVSDDGVRFPGILRLLPDGNLDKTFKVGVGANDLVEDVLVQPDGRILICGRFTRFDNTPRGHIARLNPDGSLDTTFAPTVGAVGGRIVRVGHFGLFDVTSVHAMALEPDGRLLLAGEFKQFEHVPVPNLIRLRADGSIDPSFLPGEGIPGPVDANAGFFGDLSSLGNRWVSKLRRTSGGDHLITGRFRSINQVPRNGIARLIGGVGPSVPPVVRAPTLETNLRAGSEITLTVQAMGADAASFLWFKDDQPLGTATNAWLFLNADSVSDGGNYSCLISNALGTTRHLAADLTVRPAQRNPGAVDPRFRTPFRPTTNIRSLDMTTSGEMFVSGTLGSIYGGSDLVAALLDAQGQLVWQAEGLGNAYSSYNVERGFLLPSGGALLFGQFTRRSTDPEERPVPILRLKPDGTLDDSFRFSPDLGGYSRASLRLRDGRFLAILGDDYTFVRLNADGTLDPTLQPKPGMIDNGPAQMVEDGQGRILVSGYFDNIDGVYRPRLARLSSQGVVDLSFEASDLPQGQITKTRVSMDGSIYVTGQFDTAFGSAMGVARLSSRGQFDPNFPHLDVQERLTYAEDCVVLPDLSVVVSGRYFPDLDQAGSGFRPLIRLMPDGQLDPGFDIGTGPGGIRIGRGGPSSVTRLQLTPTGKLIVFGGFSSMDGLPRQSIARLHLDPRPRIQFEGPGLHLPAQKQTPRLLWDEGELQQAESLNGPWLPVPSASSPKELDTTVQNRFFRTKVIE